MQAQGLAAAAHARVLRLRLGGAGGAARHLVRLVPRARSRTSSGSCPASSDPDVAALQGVGRRRPAAGAPRRARRQDRRDAQHGRDRREERHRLRREHARHDAPSSRSAADDSGLSDVGRDLGVLAAVELRRLAVLHGRRALHGDRLLGAGLRQALPHDRRRAVGAEPRRRFGPTCASTRSACGASTAPASSATTSRRT